MQQQLKTVVTGNKPQSLQKIDIVLSMLLFLYCALLPFEEALATSFGSILRLLGIAIIGYCIIIYHSYKVNISTFRLLVPFALWMIFSVVSIIWSADIDWWIYFTMIYLLQFAFVLFVVAYYKQVNIRYLQNGLIVGATIASAVLIFMPQLSQITEDGRRTVVILGQELDPNIVATIIMIGLFACLGSIFAKKKRGILQTILVIFLGAGMLFTGSRGALISFVAGFGVLMFLEMRNRGSRKYVLAVIVIAVITAIIALNFMPEELLTSRFSQESILGFDEYKRGSHNRYTIWLHALELFIQRPIIGYGSGNFFSAIATVYEECASHNMYILILIEEGIVGLAIFGYGLIKIIVRLYKNHLYTSLAMFTSVCVMAMTLDSITTKFFWVSIIIAIIAILKDENSSIRRD